MTDLIPLRAITVNYGDAAEIAGHRQDHDRICGGPVYYQAAAPLERGASYLHNCMRNCGYSEVHTATAAGDTIRITFTLPWPATETPHD